jgi:iron complex outermembrane recepter protein
MNGSNARTLESVCITLTLLTAPIGAFAGQPNGRSEPPAAAETASADANAGLEEIVVTAQRREERLQTVPVSVTAFTAGQLAERQIDDISSLSSVAPNMSFGSAYDPTDIVIGIRGLSETIPQLGVDPAVGLYVDGVYYSLTAGSNRAFIDMDRVEVLRGPQGTLFGRNTIGGALNITTQKPTDKLEGSAEIELGNFSDRDFTGILNVPFEGTGAAVRLVYQHSEHSGYGENTFLHTPLADAHQDYVRATLELKPNSHWQVDVTGDYMSFHSHPIIQKLGYYDNNPAVPPQSVGANGAGLNGFLPFANGHPGDLITNYLGGNFYDTQGSIDPRTNVQDYSLTATITGRLSDWVTVKSITAYNDFRRHEGTDIDGTPYDLLDALVAPITAEQRSEELQLYGDALDNRVRWIGGAYFFGLIGTQGFVSNLFAGLPFGFQNDLGQTEDNSSKGVFAQGTFELASRLHLTTGVRYTDDTRRAENFDHVNTLSGVYAACSMSMTNPVATQADCHLAGEASFSYVPWTVGVDYTPTKDLLLYAKTSKGFRSGGFAQIAPAAPAPPVSSLPSFNPENVISYEIGEKLEMLDHRLRLNADVFYADYGSIQESFNIASPNGPITVTQNVGKARFQGGEIEVGALIESLTLNASAGFIDPKFTQGPNVGLPVTNLSKTTIAVGAHYPLETAAGRFTFNVGYNWRSKEYFFEPIPGNAAQSSNIAQGDYGLLDARIDFDLKSRPLSVSLWGRNLDAVEYRTRVTGLVAGGLPFDPYIAGNPRTYGATIKYRF